MIDIKKIIGLTIGVSMASVSSLAMAEKGMDVNADEFVDAHIDVIQVQQEYIPMIKEAENENESVALQRKAQEEIMEVIETSEVTLEEYNWVAKNIQKDEELKKELEKAFMEAQKTISDS